MVHRDANGDDVRTWVGYVSAARNRITGTLIVVIDDRNGAMSHDSLDDFGDGRSPWWTICDDHGQLVQHQTRALAVAHAARPDGWCEECMAQLDAKEESA